MLSSLLAGCDNAATSVLGTQSSAIVTTLCGYPQNAQPTGPSIGECLGVCYSTGTNGSCDGPDDPAFMTLVYGCPGQTDGAACDGYTNGGVELGRFYDGRLVSFSDYWDAYPEYCTFQIDVGDADPWSVRDFIIWQRDECQAPVCTTPPTPSVASPVLTPPNHKYHDINLLEDCELTWDDPCGPVAPNASNITCVGSDEPVNEPGDGNTEDDIVIIDGQNVRLRAERLGMGDGRCYTIHFQGTDESGNVGTGTCTVRVPHEDGNPDDVVCGDEVYSVCRSPGVQACGKLGGQELTPTSGFQSLLQVCPAVAKWVAVGSVDFDAITAFKAACPSSKTVLRMFGWGADYATAQDLWNARYSALDSATPAQKAAVDFLESDNECDAGHCWDDGDDYDAFLLDFVRLASAKGYRPLIGNIAVGNPGGDVDSCNGDGLVKFGKIVRAIQAAGRAGGGWAYHGYTDAWNTDVNYQEYFSLRYRKMLRCFPQIADVPLVLTEAGFDTGGNASSSGYLANGGPGPYLEWLAWFQQQLALDPQVVGAALFAYASGDQWSSFQLDPIEPQLETLITTCP